MDLQNLVSCQFLWRVHDFEAAMFSGKMWLFKGHFGAWACDLMTSMESATFFGSFGAEITHRILYSSCTGTNGTRMITENIWTTCLAARRIQLSGSTEGHG